MAFNPYIDIFSSSSQNYTGYGVERIQQEGDVVGCKLIAPLGIDPEHLRKHLEIEMFEIIKPYITIQQVPDYYRPYGESCYSASICVAKPHQKHLYDSMGIFTVDGISFTQKQIETALKHTFSEEFI